MIFEGSCDTEDWNNHEKKINFAITGINNILKYIKLEFIYLIFLLWSLTATCPYTYIVWEKAVRTF